MIKDLIEIYVSRADFFKTLVWEHLTISLTAVVIAAVLGLFMGVFISYYKRLASVVIGLVNILYTIPSISLLGLLLPLTGIGNKTAIIALVIYGLLPMVRNTYIGLTTIDASIIEAADGLGSTQWQLLMKVKLPLALLVILAGLRNMVVMVIALSGVSAFIGAGGLGVAVYRGITTNNMTLTLAGSLLIALVAFLSDFILGLIEKGLRKNWRM